MSAGLNSPSLLVCFGPHRFVVLWGLINFLRAACAFVHVPILRHIRVIRGIHLRAADAFGQTATVGVKNDVENQCKNTKVHAVGGGQQEQQWRREFEWVWIRRSLVDFIPHSKQMGCILFYNVSKIRIISMAP